MQVPASFGPSITIDTRTRRYKVLHDAYQRGASQDEIARIIEGIESGKISSERIIINQASETFHDSR